MMILDAIASLWQKIETTQNRETNQESNQTLG